MSFSNINKQELDCYVSLFNNRPRKRNNYFTPTEFLKTYCVDFK